MIAKYSLKLIEKYQLFGYELLISKLDIKSNEGPKNSS